MTFLTVLFLDFVYEHADSVRAFMQRNKMGQFKEETPEEIQQKKERAQMEEGAAKAITVGLRCEVTVGNAAPRRGVVMYVGKISSLTLSYCKVICSNMKRGPGVRELFLRFEDPGFMTHSCHLLNLILVVLGSTSWLQNWLRPVGILTCNSCCCSVVSFHRS